MLQHLTDNNNSSPFSHYHKNLEEYRVVYIVLQLIIDLVTVIGSIIVLALLCFTKRKSNSASRKYFIALAASDLQCGLICTVAFQFLVQGVRINDRYCKEAFSAVYYSLCVTFFLLIAMTIDRYIAIVHPLTYRAKSRTRITNMAIVAAWMVGTVMGLGGYYTVHDASKHPDVLCFVTTERTNKIFVLIAIFGIHVPCSMVFILANMKIFSVILKSVSLKCYLSRISGFHRKFPCRFKAMANKKSRALVMLF